MGTVLHSALAACQETPATGDGGKVKVEYIGLELRGRSDSCLDVNMFLTRPQVSGADWSDYVARSMNLFVKPSVLWSSFSEFHSTMLYAKLRS